MNKKNSFAVIEKDGQILMTGGFILHDNEQTRALLGCVPREDQHEYVRMLRETPWVKPYFEEEE